MHNDGDLPDSNSPSAGMGFPPPPPPPPEALPAPRRRLIGSRAATAAVAGGLVVGGITGGYMITHAATTSPPASPSTSAPGFPYGAGAAAATQDLQQVAAVIGISTTQLQSELTAGKTIAAIAVEHHVTAASVISALVADETAEINANLSSGRLTQAQATQLKSQVTQRVTAAVNGTAGRGFGGPGFGGRGGFGGFGARGEDAQVLATAIGITTTQLQTELTAGKTIAAIAVEHHVTAAAVISALVASENTEVDQRVSSGQITAAQGTAEKALTTQRVTAEVNGTRPAGGGFGRWGGPGFGAPAGVAPATN